MEKPLHIDGSSGEGGGQILRTALALAAILRRPIVISRIRANRPRPGLRPQHLQAVRALAAITAAEIDGDREHSTRLFFAPRTLQGGRYRFDIGTAGACTLLAAAILPPLLFAGDRPSEVILTGGTHVPFSPPFHYLSEILLPALGKMGATVECELRRWGWHPRGNGEVRLRIVPCRQLAPLRLERRGALQGLELLIGLANLPPAIARREEETVLARLAEAGHRARSRILEPESAGPGNVVFLKAAYEETFGGFSSLGRRGKPAERVAEEAVQAWLDFEWSGATADRHLADQLVPFLALARGRSLLQAEAVTAHLRTNIWLIEQFLPVRFQVDDTSRWVVVDGVGHTREHVD